MRLISIIFAIIIGIASIVSAQIMSLKDRYNADTKSKISVDLADPREEGHGYWLVLKADTFDPDTGAKTQKQEWLKNDHLEVEIQQLNEQVTEAEKRLADLRKQLTDREELMGSVKDVLNANKTLIEQYAPNEGGKE